MRKKCLVKSKQQFNTLINCKITRLWRNTSDLKEPLYGCCYSNLLFHQLYLIILLMLIPAKGWKTCQVSPVFFSYPLCNTHLSTKISLLIQGSVSIRPRDTYRHFKGFTQGLATVHLRKSQCSVILRGAQSRDLTLKSKFHYRTFLPFCCRREIEVYSLKLTQKACHIEHLFLLPD